MSDTNPDIPQENDPRGEGEPDPEYFDEDDDDDEIPPLEEDPSSLPPGYESIEYMEAQQAILTSNGIDNICKWIDDRIINGCNTKKKEERSC